MKIKPMLAVAALSASVVGFLVTPAQALTCYRVSFDHLPNVKFQSTPPDLIVDNGNPHVESYPC